jgi:AraC-like DNA-binding protein
MTSSRMNSAHSGVAHSAWFSFMHVTLRILNGADKSVGCHPVSGKGQPGRKGQPGDGAVTVARFPMAPGARFEWHTHAAHQLAWASHGVLSVVTGTATWVLPPTRALWIPAGLPHTVSASGATTMRPLYVRPERFPINWDRPTPVLARPLLTEVIAYLGDESLDPNRRSRAEALLVDLLEPAAVTTIELRMPVDKRAGAVAAGLVADPADRRTLAAWGQHVGASGRTLARTFLTETGVPFGKWRTHARLQAALPLLASGHPLQRVAGDVGYDSASAFVAAFHREVGLTPAAYFQITGFDVAFDG